ncbi:8-oxo-dGTP pyrophosphatase MutT, NUDIX family [Thermosyntropha lipolytica DSM 11003]|uniref:8-oxo-dGTP pyrophosphatase MutT, NUDIX family n=1 Tax=Thermosyntropha lipolytica DSM 11003 TaxID=1123382 RepID=A0A1M5PRG4_9FIRM|nr:CoA pyrophosphatase [Thermosyntropha lipolytica]SHH04186.1 8-oxo-dGTP pyrophosphatase MutT, NUDIX family [Thermosyntropha lipolytica DSM 11003]
MQEEIYRKLCGRKAEILGHEEMFKSAVLLPLLYNEGELSILFEKRASALTHQPGEISFPGGRIEESDGSPQTAAVRETCEELGLAENDIKVIGPLDIMVSPFNVIVYPYCAFIVKDYNIKPNPDEVEEIFTVPLEYLLHYQPLRSRIELNPYLPDDYPVELIPNGKKYAFKKGSLPQLFYIWKDYVIWGMTARILHNFLTLIRK